MGIRKGAKKKEKTRDLTVFYTLEVSDTIKNISEDCDLDILKNSIELLAKKRLKVDDIQFKKFQAFLIEKEE